MSDFHNGYIAGLTAYARENGHSTLKSENYLLKILMEAAPIEAPPPEIAQAGPTNQVIGAKGIPAPRQRGEVFTLPQCIYNYCPYTGLCEENGCQHPAHDVTLVK